MIDVCPGRIYCMAVTQIPGWLVGTGKDGSKDAHLDLAPLGRAVFAKSLVGSTLVASWLCVMFGHVVCDSP